MSSRGIHPTVGWHKKSVALATVHAIGTSRNGSGVAKHRAALIQPSLTRRGSDETYFRGMNPTANMKCPYGTGEPGTDTSFRARFACKVQPTAWTSAEKSLAHCGKTSKIS
jgi:hypothetical protein